MLICLLIAIIKLVILLFKFLTMNLTFNTYDRKGVGSHNNLSILQRILCRPKTGLNIFHINAQSLSNKIDELRYTFDNSKLYVCYLYFSDLVAFTIMTAFPTVVVLQIMQKVSFNAKLLAEIRRIISILQILNAYLSR